MDTNYVNVTAVKPDAIDLLKRIAKWCRPIYIIIRFGFYHQASQPRYLRYTFQTTFKKAEPMDAVSTWYLFCLLVSSFILAADHLDIWQLILVFVQYNHHYHLNRIDQNWKT